MPDDLAAPSSEPGREDFRTALAGLIRAYALDVTDGAHSAEEIAAGMDGFRVKLARSSWQERDA